MSDKRTFTVTFAMREGKQEFRRTSERNYKFASKSGTDFKVRFHETLEAAKRAAGRWGTYKSCDVVGLPSKAEIAKLEQISCAYWRSPLSEPIAVEIVREVFGDHAGEYIVRTWDGKHWARTMVFDTALLIAGAFLGKPVEVVK